MNGLESNKNDSTTEVIESFPPPLSGVISSKNFIISKSDPSPYKNFIIWEVSSTKKPNDNRFILSDLRRNIEIVKSFSKFQKNWNDNEAPPFNKDLIDIAINVLRNLDYQPQVFPSSTESILFEYGKDSGEFLGIEVYEDRFETYMAPQREIKIFKICDLNQICDLVNGFNA